MHSHQNNLTLSELSTPYLSNRPLHHVQHILITYLTFLEYHILNTHKLKHKPYKFITIHHDQKLQRKGNSTTQHSLGVLSPSFQILRHKYYFRHIFVSVHGQASPPTLHHGLMTPFSELIDMYKNSWNAALLQ